MKINAAQLRTGILREGVFVLLLSCSLARYAADFSMPDIKGKMRHLSDYRGK